MAMKQYPYKFKLHWDGVKWWQSEVTLGTNTYFYYIYWWNWLPKEHRSWGFEQIYYDGPHSMFNFWFFNVSWSTPWTNVRKEE
jgi:hypothetical protein